MQFVQCKGVSTRVVFVNDMKIEMGFNSDTSKGSICFEQLSPDEFDNLRNILKSIFEFTQFNNCQQLAEELNITRLTTQLRRDTSICKEKANC